MKTLYAVYIGLFSFWAVGTVLWGLPFFGGCLAGALLMVTAVAVDEGHRR